LSEHLELSLPLIDQRRHAFKCKLRIILPLIDQ
jgi:hypothetical protein